MVEAKGLSKGQEVLLMVALFLTNIAYMSNSAYTVIANQLYKAFPDSVNGVNFMLSGPVIFLTLSTLVAPILFKRFSKKSILIVTGIIFAVAAIFSTAIVDVTYIIVMRCIMGSMQGIINISAFAMIATTFLDDEKRGVMTGFFSASTAVIGGSITLSAGFLASGSWQNVSYVFYATIPMIVCFFLFLPRVKPEKETTIGDRSRSSEKGSFGIRYWLMLCSILVVNLVYCCLIFFLSVYVAELSLGNVSFVGIVSSVGLVSSGVIAIFFGPIYARFKNYLPLPSFILVSLALALFAFVHTQTSTIISFTLATIGYGLFFTYAYAHIPTMVPAAKVDTAISFISTSVVAPTIISTYLVTFLMKSIGEGSYVKILPIILLISLLCPAISALVLYLDKKSEKVDIDFAAQQK